MKPIFDFGISQEDASSEETMLQLEQGDKLLCIASGGEVPLNLLCLDKNIKIDAIDISASQLALCRLKLLTALHITAPANAAFLGYSPMKKEERNNIFHSVLLPLLNEEDKEFWLNNIRGIERGVINYGRFELFVKKFRNITGFLIGKKNIRELLTFSSSLQQQYFFDDHIAPRSGVKYLFKIAFHPAVYKKRGLDEQGLIHATINKGDEYFKKFREFCTATKANENYFLHYFLTGNCTREALPDFLNPVCKTNLEKNTGNITFLKTTATEAIRLAEAGYYNKIHLSNIGDWMTIPDFKTLIELVKTRIAPGGKVSYRYLQINHFENNSLQNLEVNLSYPSTLDLKDRFPFYSLIQLTF